MKKIIFFFLSLLLISSCSDEDKVTTSTLEGKWLLQNIPSATKLTFRGNRFEIHSGTVTVKGKFTLNGNRFEGWSENQGADKDILYPKSFSGDVEISRDRVEFNNFSGNWIAVFSTWYGRVE